MDLPNHPPAHVLRDGEHSSRARSFLFAPQAPGLAGRPLSRAEIAAIHAQAGIVDQFFDRISRDLALGIRLMLQATAVDRPARFGP